MTTIDALTWRSMTATVNEAKSPNTFIRNLLFPQGRDRTFPTEHVDIPLLSADRETAPFVRRDGEAVLVDGLADSYHSVSFPNIRIKRPFTASELLFNRRAGTVIFPTGGQQLSAIEQHVARDLGHMTDLIANTEEWMAAQALNGEVSYQTADGANWTITFPKPTANEFNAAVAWSSASTATPQADFMAAKRRLNDEHGLRCTHAIMSQEAATNFLKLDAVKEQLDNRRMLYGSIDARRDFTDEGALYLGNYMGVECWEYSRSVIHKGSAVDLIDAGKVHFVSATAAAKMAFWYGAIPDMEALEGRLFQGKRFAKSWVQKDPSVRQALVHTRPLPVLLRPGCVVTVDTTP